MRRTTDTAPRSDDLGAPLNFLRALWELNHSMERASRSMKRALGVTGPERLFIRVVGSRPAITPAEIADVLRVDRSSITPMIKKMERRRLVSRADNHADGRSFHLTLTAKGREIDALRSGTIEQVVRDAIEAADARDVRATSALLLSLARRLTARTERGR